MGYYYKTIVTKFNRSKYTYKNKCKTWRKNNKYNKILLHN